MGAHGHGPKKEDRKAFGWVFDISNCLLLMVVGFGHSNLGMSVWVSGCLGFRVWNLTLVSSSRRTCCNCWCHALTENSKS